MAISNIPTSSLFAFYFVDVVLDGVTYRLQFKFNDRDQAWYFSIFDVNDNPLRCGIKVVSNWTLLRLWQEIQKRPPGEIMAIPQGDPERPALIDELGSEVILAYLDQAELRSV